MPRKQPFKKQPFEVLKQNEVSANLYEGMLTSEIYYTMTDKQKTLLTYMKLQMYAEHKKPVPNDKTTFSFNRHKWLEKYHIYSSDNGAFYRDRDVLIERGFIELIQSGKITRSKNIYRFSDKWKYIQNTERNG